jgi:hypothetical protein
VAGLVAKYHNERAAGGRTCRFFRRRLSGNQAGGAGRRIGTRDGAELKTSAGGSYHQFA